MLIWKYLLLHLWWLLRMSSPHAPDLILVRGCGRMRGEQQNNSYCEAIIKSWNVQQFTWHPITSTLDLTSVSVYWAGKRESYFYWLSNVLLSSTYRIEKCLTSWRSQRDGRRSWLRWGCSERWQRPLRSWATCESPSAGRHWHQTEERWTELSSCSASGWIAVWRTLSLRGGGGRQE